MKKFTAREMKSLVQKFEDLKLHEKDFSIRRHYDEILFHLRIANLYVNNIPFYSVKKRLTKGWL